MTRRELRRETGPRPFLAQVLATGSVRAGPGRFVQLEAAECLTGGMPPVAVDRADRDLWFRGFEQTYLERDVRSLAQVGDLAAFRQVFRSLAARTGGVLNLTEVARDTALSLDTVRRYVGILEASFSMLRLPAWRKARAARLVKSPKIYVADAGLAAWLNGLTDPKTVAANRAWRALLETYVLQNLRAVLGAWVPAAGIYYWREHGRHEVDFVIEHGSTVLPVEVKWTSRWTESDLSGLRRFRQLCPGARVGILACRTERVTSLGDGLFAVPLGLLVA
jgi:predicted AAA+ superfamily ATPase